jgi:hypothetical protein
MGLAYKMENGEIWLLHHFTCDLVGGVSGYFQRTPDDCFKAAVATVSQVPYDALGTSAEPARLPDAVFEFAAEQGLEAERIDSLAGGPHDELWLAFSDRCAAIGGDHHVYVARGEEIIFDPWDFRLPDGSLAVPSVPWDLRPTHGYRFIQPD